MKFIASVLVIVLMATTSVQVYGGYAAPFTNGPESVGVAVFGSPGHRAGYTANQVNNVGTLLCCEVLGFDNNRATWYQLGCSNNGAMSKAVPWGNKLANKKIRCSGNPSGTMYSWS